MKDYHENPFYLEVKESAACPADWEERFAHFARYQSLALEILTEMHRVCEKCGIPYQIAYGSLIGAMRHHDQIPWDYDVDAFVSYEDKDRLIDALRKEMDDRYYLACPEVDAHCPHSFLRISAKGYSSDMLHVDVFYLCGAPEDPKERNTFQKALVKAYQIRLDKEQSCYRASYGRIPRFCRLVVLKLLHLPVRTEEGDRRFRELATRYPVRDAKILVTADGFADWYSIPKEMVEETRLMEVGYGTVRVPVQADALLRLMYGDYLKVPPLKDRLTEFLFHTDMFKRWERMERK